VRSLVTTADPIANLRESWPKRHGSIAEPESPCFEYFRGFRLLGSGCSNAGG
jgi:hypothetical protein